MRRLSYLIVFLFVIGYLNAQEDEYYTVCQGESVKLKATGGVLYEWDDGTKNDELTITPSSDITVELTVHANLTDLVQNGDFEGGNSDFVTDYTIYSGSGSLGAGYFWVGDNAQTCHGDFRGYGHTTDDGASPDNFLVVNGGSDPNSIVWEQTITVKPNTEYAFSCWTTNVVDKIPAELQFSINGVQIGDVFSTDKYKTWDQFYEVWSSGSSTTAVIRILNQNTASGGNDFGIDDISFREISTSKKYYHVNVIDPTDFSIGEDKKICKGGSVTLGDELEGATYQWKDGSTTPYITATAAGLYSVDVSLGACRLYDEALVTEMNCNAEGEEIEYTICVGDAIELTAIDGDLYQWDNGSTESSITVSPTSDTEIKLSVYNELSDIVTNGSFSAGEMGFTTEYNPYSGTGALGGGFYWVGDDAQKCHNDFRGYGNTLNAGTSPDNFLIVNGASTPNTVVWEQTITVEKNTEYAFSCWTTNVVNKIPAELQFSINGVQIGDIFSSDKYKTWDQFYTTWDSGESTTAVIRILNQNTEGGGNDFGIDDITFTQIVETEYTYKITVVDPSSFTLGEDIETCEGETVTLDATYPGAEYLWHDGATAPIYEAIESGQYSVEISVATCSVNDEVELSFIECIPEYDTIKHTICNGEDLTLSAEGGVLYEWDNGEKTESITLSPLENMLMGVTIYSSDDDLVNNGDFSNGNTGFITNYTVYPGSGDLGGGYFWVGPDAQTAHKDFRGHDHTNGSGTGTDNFLVVNGASSPNTIVWEQTITVEPNTDYAFSCWTTNVVNKIPAELQFSINGVQIGDVFSTGMYQDWEQFYEVWNSGSSSTAVIRILNQNTESGGNDFGIDDISFYKISNTREIHEITVLDELVVNLGEDQIICEGESVTLDATTAGATYEWNNGETTAKLIVEETGIYSVTITSGSCTATDEVEITVNPIPVVDLGDDIILCNGESTVLDASASFDAYEWNAGSTDATLEVTESGDYAVTVTQSNCSASDEITVVVEDALTIDLGEDQSICEGESVILDATITGATYEWNNGETTAELEVNETGIYSVTITSGSCTATDEVEITVNPLPVVDLGDDIVLCNGESGELDASASFDVYEWNEGSTDATLEVTESGDYSVTVTQANCSASDEITVVVEDALTIDLGADQIICEGESVILDATTAGATYEWNNGETTAELIVEETGIYSVTITSGSCATTDEVEITVNPLPVVDLGDDIVLCNGESSILEASASFDAYEWNNGSTEPILEVTESGDYAVTVTKANCSASDEINVVIEDALTVGLGDDQIICEGESVTLDATTAGATYEWSNGETTAELIVEETGIYSVTITSGSCTATDEVEITINPLPVVDLGDDIILCNGESAILDASASFDAYEWNAGSTDATLEVTESGDYAVTVTQANCSASDEITVVVEDALTVDLGEDQIICEGESETLYAKTTGATYEWNNGETTAELEVNETGIYSVTITSGSCTATDEVEITVNPLPVVDLGDDIVLCNGESTVLDVSASFDVYEWNNASTDATLEVTESGVYSVTVTQANCLASDEITVVIEDALTVDLGADHIICEGESVTLDATTAGATYEWKNGEITAELEVTETGIYAVTITSDNCTATDEVEITVNPIPVFDLGEDIEICEGNSYGFIVPDTYSAIWHDGSIANSYITSNEETIRVTIYNGDCSIDDEVYVSVYEMPVINLGEDETVCEGRSVVINADISDSNVSYEWNTGETTSTIEVTESGTYNVSYELDGCTGFASKYVQFIQQPSMPLVQDIVICEGESAKMLFADGDNIKWYENEDKQELIEEGSFFMPINIERGDNSYFVTQSVEGCESETSTVLVTVVEPNLSAISIVGDLYVCENTENSIYKVKGGNGAFEWEITNSANFEVIDANSHLSSGIQNFIVTGAIAVDWAEAGVHLISVTGKDVNGCPVTAHQTVSIVALPQPDFEWDDNGTGNVSFENTTIQLPVESELIYENVNYNLEWDLAIDKDVVYDYDFIEPFDYGYHEVTLNVENEYGCTNSVTKEIFVDAYCSLYIPNAFAPDHDAEGVSLFKPVGMNIAEFQIEVYDNWGNLIWYSTELTEDGQPAESWNGTYKGEEMKADVYTWKAKATFINGKTWEGQSSSNTKEGFGNVILMR